MKIIKIIFAIIVAIMALLVIAYAYYGGFQTVTFSEKKQGGEVIVYEEMIGDYSQTPKVQEKIYQTLLNDEKIETTKGFGIYYDHPKKVETSKLRSEVGCIVDGLDSAAMAKLSEKYNVKTLPISDCVVAEFPYKGVPSIFISMMKVYPALEKYCTQQGIRNETVMEIYDIGNKVIIYRNIK
jgi:DNA gyrase inhibitor GyrI